LGEFEVVIVLGLLKDCIVEVVAVLVVDDVWVCMIDNFIGCMFYGLNVVVGASCGEVVVCVDGYVILLLWYIEIVVCTL